MTRVLDWNGLVAVAQRKNTTDKVIAVAGVPARVVKHLAVDAGFFVRSLEEEHADQKWALRSREEMVLLRALVAAGEVTIADAEDPWRLDEWRRRLAADPRCFVTACTSTTIDQRSPVVDRNGRMHLACPEHWSAIFGVLGRQHAENSPRVQIQVAEQAEPIADRCAICGATKEAPHQPDVHATAAAHAHQRDAR